MLARTDVLRPQRRHGGEHGAGHQEQEADDLFHDAHGGGIGQTALVGNDGDDHKRHLNEAILQHHRHTDAQDLAQRLLPGPEVTALQADAGAFAVQDHPQRQQHTDQLGERGAQRRTGRAHLQRPDEQVVQQDVADAGHGDEVHRAFGVAQPPENGGQNVVCCNARDADEA